MSIAFHLLYESSNGDRWFVGRQDDDPRAFVRHQPNAASGGKPSDFGLLEFMAQQQGPQHEAFLALISRLLADYIEDEEQPGG